MSTGIYPVGLEPTIAFMKRKCEFTNYSKEQLTTASILLIFFYSIIYTRYSFENQYKY
jgi:hypothetical protein